MRDHPSMGPTRREAFTLVELLIVVGIIAVLIAILLPTLSGARRAAQAVKCAANIRSIVQGMVMYANQYDGALPGSALTSGAHLYSSDAATGNNKCPSVSQINDWQAPIATMMGISYNRGASLANRVDRFTTLMSRDEFHCPANQYIASPEGTPTFPATQLGSYVVAVAFMYLPNTSGSNADDASNEVGERVARTDNTPPAGYFPRLGRVGPTARKIFIACGAKDSDASSPPSMPLGYKREWGGAFADRGPWSTATTSWDRSFSPANGGATGVDARIYGFRHGATTPNGAADSFRFTCGFFDGHVETLGDLEGSDPAQWNPTGSALLVNNSRVYTDVKKTYFHGTHGTYILE